MKIDSLLNIETIENENPLGEGNSPFLDSTGMAKSTLEMAFYYVHERGFSVIPIKREDKKPALPSWKEYQDRLPNNDEVSKWFVNGGDHNIGIVTGKVSGICVLDFDTEEAYRMAKDMGLTDTPTVKTGRGYHCYFKYREGVRNFQKRADMPGIDLRGEGGYVVAPPSIHHSGRQYEWVKGKGLEDIELTELPEWILASSPDDKTPLPELYKGVPEGQRNEALTRIIGSLVSDGLTYDQCLSLAHVWNKANTPPLPDGEVKTTVISIYNRHQKKSTEAIPVREPEADILSCVKNIEALDSTTKETDWLVYGLFPRKAVGIIAGAQKEGKTWIALEIATALSCGRDVFGLYPSKTSKVLFIEGDIPNNLIQWRLKNANYECSKDNLLIVSKFDMADKKLHIDLATSEGKNNLEKLSNIIKPDFIVLDSFSAFHFAEEKDATAIKPVIFFLTDIANRYNLHICLIHHTRKRQKKEEGMELSLNEVIGTNVLLRFASIVYGVQKRKDKVTGEYQYVFTTLGSWFKEIDPVKLRINQAADSGVWLDWTTEESIPSSKTEYVMFMITKLLAERGCLRRANFVAAIQTTVSEPTMDRAIERLLQQGKIIRQGIKHSAATTYALYPLNNDKHTGKTIDNKRFGSLSPCLSKEGGDDKQPCGDKPMINSMINTQTIDAVSVEGDVYQNSVGIRNPSEQPGQDGICTFCVRVGSCMLSPGQKKDCGGPFDE